MPGLLFQKWRGVQPTFFPWLYWSIRYREPTIQPPVWSESQGLLSEKQCGFRKNHSALDHLVRFQTFIRNAFVKKELVLTIFFDFEKAYDTTRKHGILADLWDLGFRGHLPSRNVLSGLEWVPLFPSCTSRRWGSHKVASCLRPFSALKLTTLLKLS